MHSSLPLLVFIIEAIIVVFLLRVLIDTSNSYSFHPVSNAVRSFTNFMYKIPGISSMRIARINIAPVIVSLIVSCLFWIYLFTTAFAGLSGDLVSGILYGVFEGALMVLKCFGYLLITLMLVQALCSWLPSTRDFSYYVATLTQPVIGPIQRIIPPIGMIDISLMIVLIGLYAINGILAKLLGVLWMII